MEAVMAILGGGVHVGVLLQGKKVRDDNRTLLQTGLSCEENIDTLGFMLEPNSLQTPPPSIVGGPSSHYETSQSTRCARLTLFRVFCDIHPVLNALLSLLV